MKDTTKDMGLRRAVSDAGSSSRGRRDKHVSRACNACRRKKSKCDGAQPICSTCEMGKTECTWAAEEDGRRPATKGQVDAMQLQIRTLETDSERQQAMIERLTAQLQTMGVTPDYGPLTPGGGSPGAGGSPTLHSPPFAGSQQSHLRSSSLSITIPGSGGGGHSRSISEGQGSAGFLGVPGGSPNRSPVSLASSLPSPGGLGTGTSGQFLTVPNAAGGFRGGSPSPSDFSFNGSAIDTDDERSQISDDENEPIMGPFANSSRRIVMNETDDVLAVQGHSPLALSCSPPHTPSRSRASSIRGSFSAGTSGTAFGNFRFPPSGNGAGGPGSPPGTGLGFSAMHQSNNSNAMLVPEPTPLHDEACPCDWARHLPHEIRGAITRTEHDLLLERYLRFGAGWGLLVVRGYFLRDMRVALSAGSNVNVTMGGMGALSGIGGMGSPDPTSPGMHHSGKLLHYSPALHNAILADAGAFAEPGTLLAHPDARALLARTARDLAEAESLLSSSAGPSSGATTSGASTGSDHAGLGNSPLPAVAAFAILARYHLARPRGARLAYAVFGMAVRTAMSLGLNVPLPNTLGQGGSGERVVGAGAIGDNLESDERNARDWLFWSLFCQDVDISLHVGQERSLPQSNAIPLPPLPVPANEPPSTSASAVFEYTVSLMGIAARMMDEHVILSARGPNAARLVSLIQKQLAQWHADLPDALTLGRTSASAAPGPVLLLHCAHWWIEILLHRGFYTVSAESAKFVDDAAKKILRTMRTYDKLNGFNRAPLSSVPMVFAAGAACLMRADATPLSAQKKRREAIEMANDAVEQLKLLSAPWPCCEPYALAIDERMRILAQPLRNAPQSGHSPSGSVTIHTPSHEHRHSVPAVVVEPTDAQAAAAAAITAQFGGLFNSFGGPAHGMNDAAMQDWINTSTMHGLGSADPPRDFSLGMPGDGSVLFSGGGTAHLNPDAGDGQAMFTNPAPETYQHVLGSTSGLGLGIGMSGRHSPHGSVSSLGTFVPGGSPGAAFISSSPTQLPGTFVNSSPTQLATNPFINSSPQQLPEQLSGAPVYGYPHSTHHLHHHHGHAGHGGHAHHPHHESSGSVSGSGDMSMSGSFGSLAGSPVPHHESSGSLSGSMSHDGIWSSSGSWGQSQSQ